MKVSFHRIGPDGRDVQIATVSIEDGRLQSDPPEFASTLPDKLTAHGAELTPDMGDRYLHGLLSRYEHGTYLRAEEIPEDD